MDTSVDQRGAVTTYADATRTAGNVNDGARTRWRRGDTPGPAEKFAGRRRHSGRPQNGRRHPCRQNRKHGAGGSRSGTRTTDSDGTTGTEMIVKPSNADAGSAAMLAEDPPGKNATGISHHRRYLKASTDDPRYRQYLSRTHPFRDKGTWHRPSRRHRNGRCKRTPVRAARPIDSVTSSTQNCTPTSCSVVPRPVTLTECIRQAAQALDQTIAEIAALEDM